MKHERNIKPEAKKTWRLSKTQARPLSFRPIEDEDVRYAWAAYKKGSLGSLGEQFQSTDMTAAQFSEAFVSEVKENYAGAWTLSAQTGKGFMPVGIVLGFWSHPNPRLSPFMIVGDMIWFPWASRRNRIESAVNFFDRVRSEIPMVEYANAAAQKFFEMICRHGIMRRVGTMHNVYPGEATAVFETRTP